MILFVYLSILAKAKQPHLFTVIIDDLGWSDLGAYGAEYKTPFLDTFITEESVRLDQYYIQPTCTPSRSSFITGRYTWKLGMQNLATIGPCATAAIPMNVPTIAEKLKVAGYSTHAFGKWHLGYASVKNTPVGRGFDTFSGLFQGAGNYDTHEFCIVYKNSTYCGYDWWKDDSADFSANNTYTNDEIYSGVSNMIRNHRDKDSPLFAYIAWQTIHAPITSPPRNFSICDDIPFWRRKVYCNKLNYLSSNMASFVQLLKDEGLWDNSLIVVTTDNGGMPNDVLHQKLADGAGLNIPLRAGKGTVFEGGVRGVAFITGGLLPKDLKGQKSSALLHAVDIVAGQLSAAGLPFDETDGVDIFNAVFNDTGGHDKIFIDLHRSDEITPQYTDTASAIRLGPHKYLEGRNLFDGYYINATGPPIPANQNCTPGCLFNVIDDPSERIDLSSKYPEIVRQAKREMDEARLLVNGYVKSQNDMPNPLCLAKSVRQGIWAPFKK